MRGWTLCLALTAGCAADTPAAEDGVDAGAPASPDGAPAAAAGCEEQFLIELREQVVVRLDGDGSERELFRLGEAAGLDESGVVVNQFAMRGRYVALVAFLYAPPEPHRYEYVILDVDGQVRFHRIQEEPYSPTMHLGADGSIGVTGAQAFVAGADGTSRAIGAHHAVAPPLGGHVLAATEPPWQQDASFGWLDLDTLELAPLSAEPAEYAAFAAVGDQVIYPAAAGGLALSSPSGTELVEAPGAASLHVIGSTPDGRHALLASTDERRLYRLDLSGPRLEPVAGTDEGAWSHPAAALDPDGAVLQSFHLDGGAMQLRRTADLGATWSDVGEPMVPAQQLGAGSRLVALARGEQVMILNLSTGFGDYLDEVQLVSADGARHQLSAGSLYVNGDLDPGTADLAPDGTCAATWVVREGGAEEEPSVDLVWIEPDTGESRVLRSADRHSLLRFGPR